MFITKIVAKLAKNVNPAIDITPTNWLYNEASAFVSGTARTPIFLQYHAQK